MGSHRFGWVIQALIIAMLAIIIALLIYLVTVEPRSTKSALSNSARYGIAISLSHQSEHVLPLALSV